MRRLLLHEKKILEIMLQRKPPCRCTFPEKVVRVALSPESACGRSVLINQSFTNYFCGDTSDANLELIDCHLCVPETIGNELFLVKNILGGELAFMEFMHTPVSDESTYLPYVRSIHDRLKTIEAQPALKSLASEFRSLLAGQDVAQRHKDARLKHVRLLVFDPIVCFFLGTSNSLLLNEPEEVLQQDLSPGAVQLLSSTNEVGWEGWVPL